MTVLIIVVAVLASVLVEIFRYRSMKKEDPKTTLGSVLSNGAEQLLIIFLSAIVALYIANSSEEKKMKDQIIKVLDVVQSEMEGKLSSYKKAVSGEYYVNLNNKDMDPELYDKLFAENVALCFISECEEPRGINLRNFLYSESVLIRIDPQTASKIASCEDNLLAFINEFLGIKENKEYVPQKVRADMSEIVHYTSSIIEHIEYAKMQLQGITNIDSNRKYLDFADALSKDRNQLTIGLERFSEEDLAIGMTNYDDSLIK